METSKLKKDLMLLLGNGIDEESLISEPNSFVEMDNCVIHCCGKGIQDDRYFRVSLEEVDSDKYFEKYEP